MKKRKFADGGETTEMEPSTKPEGGRFDEDIYSRARRFVESGGKEESKSTPKPAAKKVAKVSADPTAGEAKDKAAQRAADMQGETPAKRPSMRERFKADNAKIEAAVKRNRESSPDLYKPFAPEKTTTDDPMAKDYGTGRVNPKTLMPYSKGGSVGSASRRADGCATKGKTKGSMY